ncbi:MAG: putative baseplate assembly protein, partial [Terriglobia bacterium]
MGTQYYCKNEQRRQAVRNHGTLNGIDYLEVLDLDAPAGIPRQRTLLVRCLKPVPALTANNVRIEGGVRITPVKVLWAFPATAMPDPPVTAQEQAFFSSLPEPDHLLVVRTDSDGDFSAYRLSLARSPTDSNPPTGFDPQLSEIDFSFKVECPSDFDCKPVPVCPPDRLAEPLIDYLAKDYASFRRLMLDRLAVIMPDWKDRNPADLGITLVEVLAYAADHLSYYQDAVATEAYLGTARRRASLRRHARLLDYPMHEGCNARAWVTFRVDAAADGALLPGPAPDTGRPGTLLLTRYGQADAVLPPEKLAEAVDGGAVFFETMHDLTLRVAHKEIHFYTWSDRECCLPAGATKATLVGPLPDLSPGDLLLFEEVLGPQTGRAEDADPMRRHVLRLTEVQ